ncbi:hypothetical protein IG631_22608 [Alternaria alternata]|nr:hypothetical protein IG631_22608 [Alternaria alternata]
MKAEAASVWECINHEQCEATVRVRKSTSNLHGIRRNGSTELTKADEATNHITSYSYDPTRTDKKDLSTSQLFFQALHVREYPDDEQEVIDYPFHGLVNSARTSDEFHNNQICISFRDAARDESEIKSELETLSNMGFIHFPFIVHQNDNELKIEGNTRSNTVSIAHETMLQAAANQLAIQFKQDSNRGTGMEHANVVSRPEGVYNRI